MDRRTTNAEFEQEAREKRAKLDRESTSYLGDGSLELSSKKPWYHTGVASIARAEGDQPEAAARTSNSTTITPKGDRKFTDEELVRMKQYGWPIETLRYLIK